MKIEIHTKNVKLTDHQNEYVNKKLHKISTMGKIMGNETSLMKVNFEEITTKDKHYNISCKIIVELPKQTLISEELGQSIEEAIDIAEAKILNQIETYKGKHFDHKSGIKNTL